MTYSAPTPADLKTRYPAFSSVSDETVQQWLDDAAQDCSLFPDSLRARAEMAWSAHRMAELGMGSGQIPAGVTEFRSGTFSAKISETTASSTGFPSTIYGREYLILCRRCFTGPRLAWTPPAGCDV